MKQLLRFFVFILCLSCFFAKAQSITVDINLTGGSVTESYVLPFSPADHYSYSQQIYTAAEISAANPAAAAGMTISQIQLFRPSSSWNITNSGDITIYLANTDKTSFSSTTDWIPLDQLTKVLELPGVLKWAANTPFTLPLTEFFEYKGGKNLVFVFRENRSGKDNNYPAFRAYNTDSKRALYTLGTTTINPSSPPSGTFPTLQANNAILFKGQAISTASVQTVEANGITETSGVINGLAANVTIGIFGFKYRVNNGTWGAWHTDRLYHKCS